MLKDNAVEGEYMGKVKNLAVSFRLIKSEINF